MGDKIAAARAELHRLCEGPRRFTMSIPVRPDDSDIVIADALDEADALARRVAELEAALRSAREMLTSADANIRSFGATDPLLVPSLQAAVRQCDAALASSGGTGAAGCSCGVLAGERDVVRRSFETLAATRDEGAGNEAASGGLLAPGGSSNNPRSHGSASGEAQSVAGEVAGPREESPLDSASTPVAQHSAQAANPALPSREQAGRYRKTPVLIEAIQYLATQDNMDAIVAWVGDARDRAGFGPIEWDTGANHILIRTLEGDHKCQPGDWIIKGVAGEFYPCKPDIFAATYEPAVEQAGRADSSASEPLFLDINEANAEIVSLRERVAAIRREAIEGGYRDGLIAAEHAIAACSTHSDAWAAIRRLLDRALAGDAPAERGE